MRNTHTIYIPAQRINHVGPSFEYKNSIGVTLELEPIHVAALVVELIRTKAIFNPEVIDLLEKAISLVADPTADADADAHADAGEPASTPPE